MQLPDVNVLIYAHREDAPEHERVLSPALSAVAIGLIAGAMLAGGLAKALMAIADPAYGSFTALLRPYDPVAYSAGLLVIVVACVAAATLPARRAACIDPVTTLKQE